MQRQLSAVVIPNCRLPWYLLDLRSVVFDEETAL